MLLLSRCARQLCALAAVLMCAGCSDGTGPPRPGPAARLVIVSGDEQIDTVGQTLPIPLQVRAVDAQDRPVPGQIVVFRVVSGGGEVFLAATSTDAAGLAGDSWKLGRLVSELQRLEARAINEEGAPLVATFRAVAVADRPDRLLAPSAQNPVGELGAPLADPVIVLVLDQYGNPVPNALVTWTVVSGGGSLNAPESRTTATGAATVQWTLGGRIDQPQQVRATVAGTQPLVLTASAGLPAGASIVKISGDGQTGVVGQSLAQPFTVRVQLPDGGPVVGAAVTWTPTSGSSLESPQGTTGDNGQASAGLRLATTAGPHSATASVPGLTAAVFDVTAAPGAPASVTKQAGDGQTAAISEPVATAPAVLVRDQFGNPVPGATVTFEVTVGGGSVGAASAVTDANGIATAGSWTLGSEPGTNTLRATIASGAAVEFTATAQGP